MNSKWHKAHPMPARATSSQRLKWHLAHVKACGCREMPAAIMAEILSRFDDPDEVREMVKGRFEVKKIAGMTVGKATYEPGWKWSEHVGPALGQSRCSVEHLGVVITGTATAAYDDGRIDVLTKGQRFRVEPRPHDSWVIGDEPYVSLHFVGADKYSRRR